MDSAFGQESTTSGPHAGGGPESLENNAEDVQMKTQTQQEPQKAQAPLSGKMALVTGGSRGIGRAIAVKLAQAGSDVAIVYHNSHEEAELSARQFRV